MATLIFLLILIVGALVTPLLAVVSVRYRAFPFLRNTYFFWAIISFYNFNLLGWLAIPPLFLFGSHFFSKFFPFLVIPASLAFAAASVATLCLALAIPWFRTSVPGKELLPVFFNLVLLLSFLVAAENRSKSAIASALAKHKPDCVQINSFLSSLENGGHANPFIEHALFKEDGKTFFWSYTKLDFFEGREELSRNFPCSQQRKNVSRKE